jgi:hypothetical protein
MFRCTPTSYVTRCEYSYKIYEDIYWILTRRSSPAGEAPVKSGGSLIEHLFPPVFPLPKSNLRVVWYREKELERWGKRDIISSNAQRMGRLTKCLIWEIPVYTLRGITHEIDAST